MERKIGEIFEYQGEWYQCLPERCICDDCAFKNDITCVKSKGIRGECQSASRQKDGVIFKKLEKVGEPYEYFVQHRRIVMLQPYKLFATPFINGVVCNVNYDTNTIDLEIKQSKVNMEEKKPTYEELLHYYHSTVGLFAIDRNPQEVDFDWIVKNSFQLGMGFETLNPYNIRSIKPFDLEAAKSGKPVCTRDGRKARIICFDAEGNKPLIVLSKINGQEVILRYTEKGQSDNFHSPTPREDDLMMPPEKKEGWVNICRDAEDDDRIVLGRIFESREEAVESAPNNDRYTTIATVRIEWEE